MTIMRDNVIGEQSGPSTQVSALEMVPTGARLAWDVIEEACISRLTGEMTLSLGSISTRVYITNGLVYFAEHDGQSSIGERLLQLGTLSADQMSRGAIQLNNTEHLGRLFDRDPSIDRGVVELAVEMLTEETLTDIAELPVASYSTALYRHHVSGIARWFSSTQPLLEPAPTTLDREPVLDTEPVGDSELVVDTDIESSAAPSAMPDQGRDQDHDHDHSHDQRLEETSTSSPTGVTASSLLNTLTPLVPFETVAPPIITASTPPLALLADQHPSDSPSQAADETNGPVDLTAIPVPDDVAAAVRRAILAIESAAPSSSSSQLTFGAMHVTGAGRPAPLTFGDPRDGSDLKTKSATDRIKEPFIPPSLADDPLYAFSTYDAAMKEAASRNRRDDDDGGESDDRQQHLHHNHLHHRHHQQDPQRPQAYGDAQAYGTPNSRRGALRRLIDGIRRR